MTTNNKHKSCNEPSKDTEVPFVSLLFECEQSKYLFPPFQHICGCSGGSLTHQKDTKITSKQKKNWLTSSMGLVFLCCEITHFISDTLLNVIGFYEIPRTWNENHTKQIGYSSNPTSICSLSSRQLTWQTEKLWAFRSFGKISALSALFERLPQIFLSNIVTAEDTCLFHLEPFCKYSIQKAAPVSLTLFWRTWSSNVDDSISKFIPISLYLRNVFICFQNV